MKKRYHKLVYVLMLFSFFACQKDLKKANKSLKAKEMSFQYFKTKAKIKLNSNGESIGATMNLRVQDGEKIWMSVSKYGKEAMRVKINPDSAHFLNKYPVAERFYKVFPTTEYLQKAGMDLDFKSVQNLMFGIHPVKFQKEDNFEIIDSTIHLSQERNGVNINAQIDAVTSKLKEVEIISKLDTVNLTYDTYSQVGEHFIPIKFEMYTSNIQDEERIVSNAVITYTSPKFSEEAPSFSFKVPDGYEKR